MSDKKLVVPDSIWIHYRNRQEYMVCCVAENPNTQEKVVVYWDPSLTSPTYGFRDHEAKYYFRPVTEFLEKFILKE